MNKRRVDIYDKIRRDSGLGAAAGLSGFAETLPRDELPLSALIPDPEQPRTALTDEGLFELADSIRAHGVLQPILVRPYARAQYMVVLGHRRLRAAELAALKTIPARILPGDFTAQQLRILQLVENVQREDLPVRDLVAAVAELSRQGMSQRQIGAAINKSVATANLLLKLDRDPAGLAAVEAGRITLRQYKEGLLPEEEVLDGLTPAPTADASSGMSVALESGGRKPRRRDRADVLPAYRWIVGTELHLNRLLTHTRKLAREERDGYLVQLLQLREATDRAIAELQRPVAEGPESVRSRKQ